MDEARMTVESAVEVHAAEDDDEDGEQRLRSSRLWRSCSSQLTMPAMAPQPESTWCESQNRDFQAREAPRCRAEHEDRGPKAREGNDGTGDSRAPSDERMGTGRPPPSR